MPGEPATDMDPEAERQNLRATVEDLQNRLRTALNCAADMHFSQGAAYF